MSQLKNVNTIRVALFGAGAVGGYFIWGLSEILDDRFMVIADGSRKTRLETNGLCINGKMFFPRVETPRQAGEIDVLLVSTKYDALKDILDDIERLVSKNTIVLTLLNGVDSEEIVSQRIGKSHILPSMMQIASWRKENEIRFIPECTPGIFFGEPDGNNNSERIHLLEDLFQTGSLHYHICDDIWKEIWLKMAFNVSMNLPQAIVGCQIGAFADSDHMKKLRVMLRNEVCAVASALSIDISEWSAIEKMEHPSVSTAKYSTLQDLEAGRHTEIEMFAGTLVRLGKKYNISVPYCEFVYHTIKAIEEKNDGKFKY